MQDEMELTVEGVTHGGMHAGDQTDVNAICCDLVFAPPDATFDPIVFAKFCSCGQVSLTMGRLGDAADI